MEKVIKDVSSKSLHGFRVVEDGNLIKSLNRQGKMFHFIDLNYKKDGIFFHGWVDYRTNEQIKEVLDGHFIDMFRTSGCKKMLIENTKMTGSFSGINDWLGEYFMPKMIKMGLTANAVVLPSDIFSQLAVEDWDEKVRGFVTRNFGNLNEGLNWLKSL
jgi:hypothetical protein